MLPLVPESSQEQAGIVIVGLGGAGAHILQRFSGSSAQNVRLCIMSPDERLGREIGNVEFLQLGAGMNHGLGSGGDPEVGRLSIEESRAAIADLLKNTRLLVMVVGLGGGTGSGAAPVLAKMASEAGVMLVSVAVMPFSFEGKRRRQQAEEALDAVTRLSDLVFCFENDYMEDFLAPTKSMNAVFEETNTILSQATASIPMFANSPGLINIGLDEMMAAIRSEDSRCVYGTGKGYGPHRAEAAAKAALESPLVAYHRAMDYTHTVIVHVAGGNNMSLTELRLAVESIRAALPEDTDIFFGASVKPHLGEEIRVSLLAAVDATEFTAAIQADKTPAAQPAPLPAEEPEQNVEPEEEEEEEPQDFYQEYAEEDTAERQEQEEEGGEEIFSADEDDRRAAAYTPAPRRTAPQPEEEPSPYAPRTEEPRHSEMVQENLFNDAENDDTENDEPLPQGEHEDDFARRIRSLFPEDAEPGAPSPFTRAAAHSRMKANRDDLDTPPSLRFNDLRDMFHDE